MWRGALLALGFWLLAAAPVAAEQLLGVAELTQELAAVLASRPAGERARVQSVAWQPLRLPAGRLELQFALPRSLPTTGSTRLGVQVRVAGRLVKNLAVVARLDKLGPALVVEQGVAAGAPLAATHLTATERPLQPGCSTPGLAEARAARSRPALAAGARVCREQLLRELVARAGERAQLLVETQGIVVEAAGSLLDSGAAGETVRVRLDKGRVVQGTVDGAGRVHLGVAEGER